MLKPSDIQSKEFEVKMRGYDRDEVDDFLDLVIKDMTILYRDNAELTSRIKALNEEISVYQAKESEIEKSLELTKYQCEEMKKNAHYEAKQIIERAKNDAESSLHSMENGKLRMKALLTELLDKVNSL